MSQQAVYSANASVPNKKPKKKKNKAPSAVRALVVAQSIYCEICKVTCNTQEMYNKHVAGQKHNKKIKNITFGNKPIEFVPAGTSPGIHTSGANDKDNKFIYCEICKVTCNTQKMYNNHVSGKNHNKKIKNLNTGGDRPIQVVPAISTLPESQTPTTNDNDQEHVDTSSQIEPKPERESKSVLKDDLEMKKRKVLESGAKGDAVKVCELCNVVCNGPTVFEFHCKGHKHRSMVKKQEEAMARAVVPAANDNDQGHVPASSMVETKPKRRSKSASKEDLEVKKRKVLESGANGDAVKVCDLCNVVCNGSMVFEFHCKGHKHRSMVKKQEENVVGLAVAHTTVSPQLAAATS